MVVGGLTDSVKRVRNPIISQSEVNSLNEQVPKQGEHTDQILGEVGFTQSELDQLRDADVI
jgi:crotonobetainyl-CoA:carnitine CoA-transferase CaiB-like acyl-CoA transferase